MNIRNQLTHCLTMDSIQYKYYSSLIQSGELSLDGLKRMIEQDKLSERSETMAGSARICVLRQCENAQINPNKPFDREADPLRLSYYLARTWSPLAYRACL